MKYIPLAMLRDHMDHLPSYACPDDYTIRTFARGDEHLWARIEMLAGEFVNEEEALKLFTRDFGPFLDDMEDRCFLLEDQQGTAIGTATAWYNTFAGQQRGRVSWVGIVPSAQGRKLAKPLLSAVMARLAQSYATAYLTTQTTSYRAINMYLDFGFVPYLIAETCTEGWLMMEQTLNRKIL